MSDTAASRAAILAVNIGSSSIKFSVHPISHEQGRDMAGRSVLSGNIQGLEPGGQAFISWSQQGHAQRQDLPLADGHESFHAALAFLRPFLQSKLGANQILAVAHRVVHGGGVFSHSVRVTPDILARLKAFEPLAPLHQPHNLIGIEAFSNIFSDLPQIACFDTAFHSSISKAELTFPLTKELFDQGLHRYGFHGLSYQYVSTRLAQKTAAAQGRLLMAHLGNGSSLCACVHGRSFSTTMGFSAVGGLMMGTRCGDLDPGVVLHLLRQGMQVDELERLFYRQSGLKGISGISADMRTLRENDSADARFAIELYTHRVIREAGGLMTAMGGVDAIAFAGGIGENDFLLRSDVCKRLGFLGVEINEALNKNCTNSFTQEITALHTSASKVEVWVVPTDEGIIAAEEALQLL